MHLFFIIIVIDIDQTAILLSRLLNLPLQPVCLFAFAWVSVYLYVCVSVCVSEGYLRYWRVRRQMFVNSGRWLNGASCFYGRGVGYSSTRGIFNHRSFMAITYNKKLFIYSHMHSVQIYLFDSAYYTNIAYISYTCVYNLYMCICIYICILYIYRVGLYLQCYANVQA